MSATRQAIVLIHGIGEQKPMATLRRFAREVLPPAKPGKEQYWNKPDPVSELFELRKLQCCAERIDLYEYYWAYQIEGTGWAHLGLWLASLLFRRPSGIPRHLRPLWAISWILCTTVVTGIALGMATPFSGAASAFLVAALAAGAQFFLFSYLGDAARYLSPSPRNIALRQQIRAGGIKLLRHLHTSHRYDRIVVVGHSLGSVIGYDILKHYWQETCGKIEPIRHRQPALTHVEMQGPQLGSDRDKSAVHHFQNLQHALWLEQRSLENPWLVTDFITLGSPLAHAALLLAKDETELWERQHERELPICPPALEKQCKSSWKQLRYAFPKKLPYGVHGQKVTLRVLHHAALFACVRWTNLYFPAWGGLFGDLVGGPLKEVFGPGVNDVPVTCVRWKGWARFNPAIHTAYWRSEPVRPTAAEAPPLALDALKSALNL